VTSRPATWAAEWTMAEDALVRSLYAVQGARACADALPGRSVTAVMKRARKLGLATHRRWTDLDYKRLRLLWGDGLSLETIAKKLGRTPKTTYWRAQHLGLPLGCPQGYEYLTAASERTGYDRTSLRIILRWAGVDVYRAITRESKPRGRLKRHSFRHHYVDPDRVDEAVAGWLRTECVEAAARRIGVCGETIRRWLIDAGHTPPTKPRARWRVESAEIDRVAADGLRRFAKHRRPRVRGDRGRFAKVAA